MLYNTLGLTTLLYLNIHRKGCTLEYYSWALGAVAWDRAQEGSWQDIYQKYTWEEIKKRQNDPGAVYVAICKAAAGLHLHKTIPEIGLTVLGTMAQNPNLPAQARLLCYVRLGQSALTAQDVNNAEEYFKVALAIANNFEGYVAPRINKCGIMLTWAVALQKANREAAHAHAQTAYAIACDLLSRRGYHRGETFPPNLRSLRYFAALWCAHMAPSKSWSFYVVALWDDVLIITGRAALKLPPPCYVLPYVDIPPQV